MIPHSGAGGFEADAENKEEAWTGFFDEREMLIDALKNARGNITQAATILKTTVRKFAYKAQKYGVSYKHYR